MIKVCDKIIPPCLGTFYRQFSSYNIYPVLTKTVFKPTIRFGDTVYAHSADMQVHHTPVVNLKH